MRFLKYFIIFAGVSVLLTAVLYVISGGHILFLLGGIPLVFGGFWSFGGNRKQTEE